MERDLLSPTSRMEGNMWLVEGKSTVACDCLKQCSLYANYDLWHRKLGYEFDLQVWSIFMGSLNHIGSSKTFNNNNN